MQLSERLKETRKIKGKKQSDIAQLLNITRAAYGEYERGNNQPPIDKLVIIADHLNVTLDYLVGTTEKEVENYKRLSALYAAEIAKLETKKLRLFDLFEEGIYTKQDFVERKKIVSDQLQNAYQQAENLQPPDEHEIENKITTFHTVVNSLLDNNISGHIKNQLLKDIIKVMYYTYNNGVVLDIHFK